ncbi:hypothetical protein VNI00_012720 [Paramarasmius palmivorus]|uniref:F-box domain-containing protein n=1 Tax=Paramarasmius palmivorus TaxID=297713 RepID=A0AAW0C3M4_9AGAR
MPSNTIILCNKCSSSIDLPSSSQIAPSALQDPYKLVKTHVLSSIEQEEAIIGRCDVEISRIRAILSELETNKLIMENRVREQRYSISALRSFPEEIYDMIFSFMAEPYSLQITQNTDTGIQVQSSILAISQVSRYWRNLTHALPRLWSSISVDCTGLPAKYRTLIEAHLQNAKQALLILEIDAYTSTRDDTDDFPSAISRGHGLDIFRYLMSETHRCAELKVYTDWDTLSDAIPTEANKISFPELQYLCADIRGYQPAIFRTRLFWQAISEAPKLVIVDIPFLLPSLFMSYSHFKTVRVEMAWDVGVVLDLLRQGARLENLDIRQFCHVEQVEEENPCAVVSESLRTLFLRATDRVPYMNMTSLFDYMSLPSLEQFTLTTRHDYATSGIPCEIPSSMITMLRGSSLRELELQFGTGCPLENTLSDVLGSTPNVTAARFSFSAPKESNKTPCLHNLVSKLVLPDDIDIDTPIQPLAPKLTHLFLVWDLVHPPTSEDLDDICQLFVDMVDSRAAAYYDEIASKLVTQMDVAYLAYALPGEEQVVPENKKFEWVGPRLGNKIEILGWMGTSCYVGDIRGLGE